jgi:hypothetical protein
VSKSVHKKNPLFPIFSPHISQHKKRKTSFLYAAFRNLRAPPFYGCNRRGKSLQQKLGLAAASPPLVAVAPPTFSRNAAQTLIVAPPLAIGSIFCQNLQKCRSSLPPNLARAGHTTLVLHSKSGHGQHRRSSLAANLAKAGSLATRLWHQIRLGPAVS